MDGKNTTFFNGNNEMSSLHEEFFETAVHCPKNIAIIWYEEERKEIMYQDLVSYVRRMIQMLKEYDVTRHDYIAISLPKGIWQVVSTLAVLSMGCAYVPMDIEWPIERKRRICKKANIKYMIGISSAPISEVENVKVIYANHSISREESYEFVKTDMDNSAYVIFTSGTTGEPKGVEITHGAAINTIHDINKRFNIGSKDRCFAISELSFDLSVYDIFGMLAVGGSIVIPRQDERKSADKWFEQIEAEGVTLWNSVPAIYEMLLLVAEAEQRKLPLKKIFLSGDWISKELFLKTHALMDESLFVSLGGATEAAIWSVYYVVERIEEDWSSIPYGYPLAGQKVLVMDSKGNESILETSGELWIGGSGVAKGYINEERLSKEKFIFYKGERWYKTGDLVKLSKKGYLIFLGRMDYQVKLNGYRIELKEIENTILQCKGVDNDIALIVNRNGRHHLAVAVKPYLDRNVKAEYRIKQIRAEKSEVTWTREATIKNFLNELLKVIEIKQIKISEMMEPLYNLWKKKEKELVTGNIDVDLKEMMFSMLPLYLDIFNGKIETKEILKYPDLNPEYLVLKSMETKIFLDKIIKNIIESKIQNRIGILQARTGRLIEYIAKKVKGQEYILFDTSLSMLNMTRELETTENKYKYSVINGGNIESEYVGTCDIVIAVNTLHQFEDKAYGVRLASMLLKNEGRFMLIECGKEDAMALVTSYVLENQQQVWNKNIFSPIEEWGKILVHNGFSIEEAEVSETNGIEYIDASLKVNDVKTWKVEMDDIMNRNLPNYMIPEEFYYFIDFPLNENGKVDRNKVLSIIQQKQQSVNIEATLTNEEQKLAKIWKSILGGCNVSKENSFFEMGGDSLLSTKLLVELKNQYNVEMSLTDIFENPYLDQMVLMLEKKTKENSEMVEGEI